MREGSVSFLGLQDTVLSMNPLWLLFIKVLVLKRNSNIWWKGVLKASTKGPKLCEFFFTHVVVLLTFVLCSNWKQLWTMLKVRSRRDRVLESSKTDILKQIHYQQMWLLLTASWQTGQTCSLDYSTVFFVVVIVDIQNIMWSWAHFKLSIMCDSVVCIKIWNGVHNCKKKTCFLMICLFTVIHLPKCDCWSFTSNYLTTN